jgi:hypothetical protein
MELAMRRKTFDAILTAGGLVLAVVLLVAGGLLTWGSTFVSHQVKTQLAAERIFIPAAGSDALADPAIKPYLTQYAGQQLTTGAQAEAYADHFIAVHLTKMTGGKTYSELSAQSQADPTNTKLAAEVNTVFKGETLRGLLLNAYAFDTMGRIAGIAAVAAFSFAGLMLLLVALGVWHLRRTPSDAEVHIPGWHPEAVAS